MKAGKLPIELLEKLIFSHINIKNREVVAGPAIGMDCGALDIDGNLMVFTSDPITAAGKGAGKLAIHVNCNDIATTGLRPIALLVTVLAPVGTTEEELNDLAKEMSLEADEMGVDIIGGHTEITDAVSRTIISVTAMGYGDRKRIEPERKPQAGDAIIMTKVAGLEGTSILCHDKEKELQTILSIEELVEGQEYSRSLSVLPEGELGRANGALVMHDVTEGGVLGAVWELAHGHGLGADVFEKNIPVTELTKKICVYYNIDPLRLISSGTMIMICQDGELMVSRLKEQGIEARVIGSLKNDGMFVHYKDGTCEELAPPDSDELFKVI